MKKNLLKIISILSVTTLFSCGQNINSTGNNSSSTQSIEKIDYGTLIIKDIEISFLNEMIINPIFSKEEYTEELNYSFEGNNISIVDGVVKGLVAGTNTKVIAKSEHFSTSFNVKVNYLSASLTNKNGLESKYTLPNISLNNYLLHITVDIPTYVKEYTRLSSFAFNGSDNSWYNIEMGGDGVIRLYAHFNNIEKYGIFLGNKEDLMVDNCIHYQVEILKKGQATNFYFNNRLVCGFDEEDMVGYDNLSSFEITAAADRDNAGKYVVNLTNIYYVDENNEEYINLINNKLIKFDDFILSKEDGSEDKYNFGDISMYYKKFIFSTEVDVMQWDNNKTRPCAFAFNGSDNSWYNIEMNNDGGLFLYGKFNDVEKYNIFLDNKENLMVNNNIHFTINLLKDNQATYFFFNEKLVCWFTEDELKGYNKLSTFEVTSSTDVWQDGEAYKVNFKNSKFENDSSILYETYMKKIYKTYDDITLKDETGLEQHAPEICVTDRMIFSTNVIIKKDLNTWFRPSAFAFNNSDNSWYNIEMNEDGNLMLYARFNGVEKYGIYLGKKNECLNNGYITYKINILKDGQATYFFFNDHLKASFSLEEMGNYNKLFCLNITSSCDRSGSSYEVEFKNQKVEDASTDTYKLYQSKCGGNLDE